MADGEDAFANWKAYYYYPSTAAAVIFMLLFLGTTFLHTYQLFRTRTWFFIPLLIGAYFEGIGYIGRLISAKESPDWTLPPYILQNTLLLVAPALFAASIYMTLGRIIMLVHGERHSLIRLSWLTKIFVGGDILSFLMQASGAGLLVKDQESQDMGEGVILGGLFVQIIFFSLFMVSALIFQTRIAKDPTAQFHALHNIFRKHMYALYATGILIVARSIIRVIEYIQGYDGYILTHEYFLYVFDALPMFFVLVIFNVVHSSEINCLLGRGKKMTTKGGLSVEEFKMTV